MDRVDSDKAKDFEVVVWKEYERILQQTQRQTVGIKFLERFEFYEQAKKAYAIIITG